MFSNLRKLSYNDRLKSLGLWSLEERRNRADLIEVFKMAKGISKTPLEELFDKDSESRTRGHSFKLKKKLTQSSKRHNFFSERVVSRWNSLTQEAVDAGSLNAFKGQLEKMRKSKMGFLWITCAKPRGLP